jgi:uncharacterized membrane protein YphA (DoxX/SURF4 family)
MIWDVSNHILKHLLSVNLPILSHQFTQTFTVMKTQIKNFLFGSIQTESSKVFDWSYLLFRIYAGLSIADGAGLSKVFHKINEKGDDSWSNLAFGTSDWFVKQVGDLGFTFISPSFWAYLAVYGEFIGGLLIAFGIFTRLSSIQLAFQFFIVAFVWYGDPAPMIGMYYQQLIFWSFVMTFAVGDGKYSLATLFSRKKKSIEFPKPVLATVCFLFMTFMSQAQTEPTRVSFTIKNPSLKSKMVDFKSYSASHERFTSGYGYLLNGLASHAINLPVPVYVFKDVKGEKELLFVVTAKDNGKTYNVNEDYEISREQWLEAARAEMNQRNFEKAKEDNSIENIAKKKGLKLVNINVKGSSWMPSMAHVRYQLPWGTDNQLGFSSSLSKFNGRDLILPVGTKVYQCSDKYWDRNTKFTEKCILTVDDKKSDITVIIE